MSTEPTASESNAPESAPFKLKGLTSSELNTRVAEAIVAEAPRALTSVIKTLVDREIDKRAQSLLGGIELAITVKRDLAKIDRPDVPALLSRDGKPVGEGSYTQNRLKEIKKLTEKLAKVEKALDAATREQPDFTPLNNLKSEIEKADKEVVPEAS